MGRENNKTSEVDLVCCNFMCISTQFGFPIPGPWHCLPGELRGQEAEKGKVLGDFSAV